MLSSEPNNNTGTVESPCSSLDVQLSDDPVYSRESQESRIECYGAVYNRDELARFDIDSADDDSVAALVNRLGGYFCLIVRSQKDGTIRLATDLYGNYRLYLIRDNQTVMVSDDWRSLVERLRTRRMGLLLNPHEQYYFQRHRYTTGGGTWVHGLDKVLPGSLLTQRDGHLTWRACLQTDIARRRDNSHYADENVRLLTQTISDGIKADRPTFLFFSGGIDSTYLACVMKAAGIEFTPLISKYDPVDRDNLVDQKKAETVARRLGMPLMINNVDARRHMGLVDRAARRHPFDMPYPVPFEYMHQWLADKYGPCNLVNGQSSDSIYCWGASGRTIGSFLQRFLVNDLFLKAPSIASGPVAAAIASVYRHRWRVPYRFRVPTGGDDYWVGLLDPQGYLPVIHTEAEYAEYHRFLLGIVRRLRVRFHDDSETLRIYMKMMYLQGPTNTYIIQAARAYGHNLVLPFVDARVLNLRRSYQDDWRNLWFPRYILENTLKRRFSFDPGIIDQARKADCSGLDQRIYDQTVSEAYQRWHSVCRDLF